MDAGTDGLIDGRWMMDDGLMDEQMITLRDGWMNEGFIDGCIDEVIIRWIQ